MNPTDEAQIPAVTKLLCGGYALIAVFALIATTIPIVPYYRDGIGFLPNLTADLTLNPASRSVTADLAMLTFAVVIFMVIDARKHDVRFVWLYVIGAFVVAIAVWFPLYMIARELKLARTEPSRLGVRDAIGLVVIGAILVFVTIWSGVPRTHMG